MDALPADGAEFQIAVRIRDSKDTVISQSNEISVVIDQETAKQAGDAKKQGLENSLIIDSIYPGTEITSEMLKTRWKSGHWRVKPRDRCNNSHLCRWR